MPVCRLSERDINIQFCLKSSGNAEMNLGTEVTVVELSSRYFLIPAIPAKAPTPSGEKSVMVGIVPAARSNLARTERTALMFTVQEVDVPEVKQSPAQPAKAEPAGTGRSTLRVTDSFP